MIKGPIGEFLVLRGMDIKIKWFTPAALLEASQEKVLRGTRAGFAQRVRREGGSIKKMAQQSMRNAYDDGDRPQFLASLILGGYRRHVKERAWNNGKLHYEEISQI